MRSSIALLAVAVTSVSAAVANYTSSLNMTISVGTVDAQTRATWCQAQTNTCTILCDDGTDTNSCTQSTLVYDCTCASNSSAPGLQYYTQTMPTFICQELYSQCITENANDADGQDDCKTNIEDLCGTLDPPSEDDEDEATSTTAAATTSTRSSSSSDATDDSVTTTTSDGFAAATMAPAGKGAAAAVAIGMLAYLV